MQRERPAPGGAPGGRAWLLSRCGAIKASGERCKAVAIRGSEWCPAHHPDYQEQRKRAAKRGGKRGGRGRPQAELSDLKTLLSDLTDRVLGGEGVEPLDTGKAAVANQLINTRLRAVELERKIREAEDLEARLEALEQAAEQQKGARKWGA